MVAARSSPLRLWLLVGTTLCSPGIARAAAPVQPQNGRFVAGTGSIASGGAQTTVTQSTARGIVDWKSFNVGAGGTVAFQNGTGATLNRVTGADMSRIAGSITSTGSVYLVNPQGVVIAPGGRVITGGGFVASTRPVDPAGFMAGGATTLQGSSAGDIRNAGTIQAGGDVVLVGRSVSNSGSIAAGGNAALTAADQVTLQVNGGSTRIVVQGGGGNVSNTGSIDAANASLLSAGGNVYALAGRGAGYVNATGTATRNGRVMLVAGGNTEVSGALTASGPAGAGGTVVVAGANVALKPTAAVNASGPVSGGRVLIGGDRAGGANPAQKLVHAAIPNATHTEVAAGATIKADGGTGPGGSVVVWSNQTTDFAGSISARGGSGPGFAEVSSHGVLNYTGRVDLRSVNGLSGTLLLDPADVYISAAAAPEGASAITPTLLAQQLATANVTITTSGGSGNGDIFVVSPVTWSSASTLTLRASRDVTVRANLTATGAGGVVLAADSGGTGIGTVSFQGGVVALNGGAGTVIYNPVSYTAPTNYAPFFTGAVPQALMLVNTAAQVAAMGTNAAGLYALGRDIDASSLTGFAGIPLFSGVLDGQGHAISNLTVAGTATQAGLFGTLAAGSVVRNLALTDATVGNAGAATAGILAGQVAGSVVNVSTSGSVVGQVATGGLAGTLLAGGSVAQSSSSATVYGLIFSGGLVGVNRGSIANGLASGDVTAENFYVGGLVGYNYGSITGSLSVGNTTGVRSDGAIGYDLGPIATNTYYDSTIEFNNLSQSSTRGLTTAQLQGGALPGGFGAATWLGAAGAYPILRGAPGPGVVLGGTVYSDRAVTPLAGAGLGVLIDGALYEGITAGANGTWSLGVPSAAVSASGSNVLAALTGATAGNTLFAGVTGSAAGIDVYGNTLRLVSGQAGGASVSGLLSAQAGAIGSSSWGALMVPGSSLAGPRGYGIDLVSRGALAVDQTVSTTGTLLLQANGTISQTAALAVGGLALNTPGAVTLTAVQNQIGVVAGSAGSLDLAAAGGVAIGSAGGLSGLASGGTLRLTAGGTITVNAPVSAVGSGDALVLAGAGFAETVGAGALSVEGGGRWLVYLPNPSDASLSGLSALAYYNTGFDTETRTGGAVAGAGNRFAYQLAPTLTVAANSETTTYNGLTPGTSYSVSGLVGTDTLQQALSGAGTVGGAGTAAGRYTLTVDPGTLASDLNYKLAYQTGTLTVLQKVLTGSVANAGSIYGTTAVAGAVSLAGVIAGDTVGGTTTISQGDMPVTLGARTDAGRYTETVSGLTGASSGNYVLAGAGNTAGTLTIAPLAVSWTVANASATYGTVAVPGAASLPGVLAGDAVGGTVLVSQSGVQAGIPVALGARTAAGSYVETVSGLTGAAAGNYTLAPSGNTAGLLTIAPLAIGYSVANANATYGTTAVPGVSSFSGVLAGDSVGGTVLVSQSGVPVALGARTGAGAYAETVSGLTGASAGNYVLAAGGNTPGVLTIAPLALSWSVANANATYGTVAVPGAASLPGVLDGDSVSGTVLVSQSGVAVPLGARTGAGSYAETVSGLTGASAGNYTLAAGGNTPGTLTIAPLAVSWSVANAGATYGTTAVPGAAALGGVLEGDAVGGIVAVSQSGIPIALGARTGAGAYGETVSGLTGASAGNYTLAAGGNTAGVLTIAPLAVSYSVANATAGYATPATPGGATIAGVLPGDSVSGVVTVSLGGVPVPLGPQTPAGRYAETVSGLTGPMAANYTIAAGGNTPGTLTITPLPAIPIVRGSVVTPTVILASTSFTGPATAQPIVSDGSFPGVFPGPAGRELTTSDAGPATATAGGDLAAVPGAPPGPTGVVATDPAAPALPGPSLPGPAVPLLATPDVSGPGAADPVPAVAAAAPPGGDPAAGPAVTADASASGTGDSAAPAAPAAEPPMQVASLTPPDAGTAATAGPALSGTGEPSAASPANPPGGGLASAPPEGGLASAPPEGGVASAPPEGGLAGGAAGSGAPAPGPAVAGDPASAAIVSAIADAAAQSADAAAATGVGKQAARAAFNSRVGELMAAGQPPAAAIAGARQAIQQMIAASTRTGAPTQAQLTGDAFASPSLAAGRVPGIGPGDGQRLGMPSSAGASALAAALASGASTDKAMRDAAIATGTANAMLALSTVPVLPGGEMALSMSGAARGPAGGLSGPADGLGGPAGGLGGAFEMAYAEALAAGKDAGTAQAAAQRAVATLREMDGFAGLTPSARQLQAGFFANGRLQGPAGAAGPAGPAGPAWGNVLSGALAVGKPLEEAVRRAEVAEASGRAQAARSLVPPTGDDARFAALALGHQAGECGAASSCGASDAERAQQAAATVPVPDPDLAGLAQGQVPRSLSTASPALLRLLHIAPSASGRLRAGAADPGSRQVLAAGSASPDAAERLIQNLAAGTARPADIALLANGGDIALFTRILLGGLVAGRAPADAVNEARAVVAGFERDAAIPGGQTPSVPADYAGTGKAGAAAPPSQH